MEQKKVQVSQDTLYEFMTAHDVKMVRLAEMIYRDPDMVTSCFTHRKDIHGVPRSFSAQSVALINEALPRLAEEIYSCRLKFGSDKVFTNRRGCTYDPGLIEPIKELGKYLNITAILTRVCGWSKAKKASVFGRSTSSLYGNISEADAIAINNEVLAIVGVLGSYELVCDDGSISSGSQEPTKE